MATRRHNGVEEASDASEALAEGSPLLRSRSTSPTLRNSSPARNGVDGLGRLGRSVSSGTDSNAPRQRIGTGRAVVIILSVWVFIFLQGKSTYPLEQETNRAVRRLPT